MSIFDLFKKNSRKNKEKDLENVLRPLGKNEIILKMDKTIKKIPAHMSKIGGTPLLPVGFTWPEYKNRENGEMEPLSFFCQINLKEAAAYDKDELLPKKGILSFFYDCESFCWGFDPEDKGAAKVYYFENVDELKPGVLPENLNKDYIMPEIAVSFETRISYPMFEEFEMHSDITCDWEEYDEALKKLGLDVDEREEDHKLLGYADIIQGEMLTDCERSVRGLYSGNPESFQNTPADLKKEIHQCAKDWIMLLQLGTIEKDDFVWMFGDCGMLYFYIKKNDLAAKRFENTWFSLQCY